jgi:hypothetical protein
MKHSPKLAKTDDPYSFIALQVIRQAFREIRCYYYHRGREDEIRSGYEAINWIIKMKGNYRLYAQVTHLPLEKFHQLSLAKINTIKKDAYARYRVPSENKPFQVDRETDINVLSEDH